MTPGARIAAAIDILDQIINGTAAEKALTGWARASRFAGSGDRAAIRDHVYDVLRAKKSLGDGTGRSLIINLCLRDKLPIDALFNGQGHAPAPINDTEKSPPSTAIDIPDWLWPHWQDSLDDAAIPVAKMLQQRAPIFLRVNQKKSSVMDAIAALKQDNISAEHYIHNALRVTDNARRIKNSTAYLNGLVELQDASSQAAVMRVPLPAKGRLLDYCAGGGGKGLAFADQSNLDVYCHDIAPQRMKDIPARAQRAGVQINMIETAELNTQFEVVFVDAPCSGSGTWRRTPQAKWELTQERLNELNIIQRDVLKQAAKYAKTTLAYATCSVLQCENQQIVDDFCATSDWIIRDQMQYLPGPDGDGFFLTLFSR